MNAPAAVTTNLAHGERGEAVEGGCVFVRGDGRQGVGKRLAVCSGDFHLVLAGSRRAAPAESCT